MARTKQIARGTLLHRSTSKSTDAILAKYRRHQLEQKKQAEAKRSKQRVEANRLEQERTEAERTNLLKEERRQEEALRQRQQIVDNQRQRRQQKNQIRLRQAESSFFLAKIIKSESKIVVMGTHVETESNVDNDEEDEMDIEYRKRGRLAVRVDSMSDVGCIIGLAAPNYNPFAQPGAQLESIGLRSSGHIWVAGEIAFHHHPQWDVGAVIELEYDAVDGVLTWKVDGFEQKTVEFRPGPLGLKFCVGGGNHRAEAPKLVVLEEEYR